jgi:hypothetical protein
MSREAADNPVVASVKSRLHTAAPVDVAVVSACRVIWIPTPITAAESASLPAARHRRPGKGDWRGGSGCAPSAPAPPAADRFRGSLKGPGRPVPR